MRLLILSASGKGFGAATPSSNDKASKGKKISQQKRSKRVSKTQEVNKALEMIERAQGGALDTTSSDNGRVDYVKVKDWGSGRAEDLGNLQVASSPQSLLMGKSFYDFLARQLEALQTEGALETARPAGTAALPPFQHWAFAEAHYAQYLEDLYCVHSALEDALQSALTAEIGIKIDGNSDGTESAGFSLGKVKLFGNDYEIARSKAIQADLAQLKATSEAPASLPSSPSANAVAYSQILNRLKLQAERAENTEEYITAVLKIAAHAYVVMLTLLTSGTRIGAAATEKLNLFKRDAVHTFRDYPELESPPLAVFRKAVDDLGSDLDLAQRDVIVQELTGAMRQTAVLLEALAREN